MNRRDLMAATAALPVAVMATPSGAGIMPTPSQPSQSPAETTEKGILHHVREIMHLLRKTAPDGSTLRGFSCTFDSGTLDEGSIWASALLPDYGLTHMRPGVYDGWRADGRWIA
jgi:hypothetical protein